MFYFTNSKNLFLFLQITWFFLVKNQNKIKMKYQYINLIKIIPFIIEIATIWVFSKQRYIKIATKRTSQQRHLPVYIFVLTLLAQLKRCAPAYQCGMEVGFRADYHIKFVKKDTIEINFIQNCSVKLKYLLQIKSILSEILTVIIIFISPFNVSLCCQTPFFWSRKRKWQCSC